MTISLRASRKCAEWLIGCRQIGWPRSMLDQLEDLWWKYHDRETGRPISPTKGKLTDGTD